MLALVLVLVLVVVVVVVVVVVECGSSQRYLTLNFLYVVVNFVVVAD